MADPKVSSNRPVSRRGALKLAAAGAVGGAIVAGLTGRSEAAEKGKIKDIKDGGGMLLTIPGAPIASENIEALFLDPLTIDIREMTTGTDVEYRLYGPGAAHWGSASVVSATPQGASRELQAWFMDCASGKNIRKNITVTLFAKDKTPVRTYNLMDCFPTQWSVVNFDTSSTVQTETLRVKVGRIEFKT